MLGIWQYFNMFRCDDDYIESSGQRVIEKFAADGCLLLVGFSAPAITGNDI